MSLEKILNGVAGFVYSGGTILGLKEYTYGPGCKNTGCY